MNTLESSCWVCAEFNSILQEHYNDLLYSLFFAFEDFSSRSFLFISREASVVAAVKEEQKQKQEQKKRNKRGAKKEQYQSDIKVVSEEDSSEKEVRIFDNYFVRDDSII